MKKNSILYTYLNDFMHKEETEFLLFEDIKDRVGTLVNVYVKEPLDKIAMRTEVLAIFSELLEEFEYFIKQETV